MHTWSHEFISKALGVPTQGKPTTSFTEISTDSRNITAGCLFAAVPGDRFDGHDFIKLAIESGATGILCQRHFQPTSELLEKAAFYIVDDTIQGLRKIAQAHRIQFQIPVLAVAGSVGKTTTKELLASVLSGKFTSILKTQGSENGFLGVALTLLRLRPSTQVAVIEIGIDEIGAMIQHLEVVRPTHACLTAIGPEHLEKLMNIETVTKEEALALTWTASHSPHAPCVVLNRADPAISKLESQIAPNRMIKLDSVKTNKDANGMTQILLGADFFRIPLPGTHNAQNAAIAIEMAKLVGLNCGEIQSGLLQFKVAFGRTEIKTLSTGTLVLCDYYNANPTSVNAALGLLQELQEQKRPNGRRLIALADMLELGAKEETFHRELAPSIQKHHIEVVFLFGARMNWLADELKKKNYKGHLRHFTSQVELASALKQELEPEDTLLIKGSRSMKMETVFEILFRD